MSIPKKDILINRRRVTAYSIGWFSKVIHRSQAQIRRWQRAKLLPEPLLDLNGEMRWYLADELVGYTAAFKQSDIRRGVPITETDFKKLCYEFHAKLRKRFETEPDKLLASLPHEKHYTLAGVTEAQMRDSGEHIENILSAKRKNCRNSPDPLSSN